MAAFGPKVKKKPMAEINVVQVDLPQAPSEPIDDKEDEPLIVSVDKSGAYYIELGGEPKQAKPLPDITAMVSKVLGEKPTTPVLVWGDSEVS